MVVDYEAAMEGLYYIDGVVASAFFFLCACAGTTQGGAGTSPCIFFVVSFVLCPLYVSIGVADFPAHRR